MLEKGEVLEWAAEGGAHARGCFVFGRRNGWALGQLERNCGRESVLGCMETRARRRGGAAVQ